MQESQVAYDNSSNMEVSHSKNERLEGKASKKKYLMNDEAAAIVVSAMEHERRERKK